ncbi:Sec1-like protein [Gongronella butleri]|nr:Sec1-like protein [Gongronella butleri]
MYAAAHVHFINGLDNVVFDDFTRRLNAAGASKYIQSLKEMYVDFMVREPNVFTLDDPGKFLRLFNKDISKDRAHIDRELDDMAKQLLCLCVTLGENPLIRYHRPLDVPGTINRNIPWHLAKLVQNELDNFCKVNPEFPPPRDPPLPRGTLVILDRTIDPVAPFLHEFTYQAMLADLLQTEDTSAGIKYAYEYTQEDGTSKETEIVLNEQDTVFTSIRHMHIASTTEQLIDDFNKFVEENKGSSGGQSSVRSLNDMKNVIANLPQFQEMKTKFSAHMAIASDCMTEFTKQNLEAIGLIEQNMACNETPDGHAPKHLVDELIPILDDPYTSQMIKTRLIMLWISASETIDTEQLELLLAHARLDQEYKDAIDNLSLLGVQLSKSASRFGQKATKKERKKKDNIVNPNDVPFDLSRYVPVVKRVVEGHMTNTVDQSLFPLLRMPEPENQKTDASSSRKQHHQLRVYKTQWHKKSTGTTTSKPPSGPPVIIFVAGGITWSEARSAYELAASMDREVYIGSTHIISPDNFVRSLGNLDKPLPPAKSFVPHYDGASSQASSHSGNHGTAASRNKLLKKW